MYTASVCSCTLPHPRTDLLIFRCVRSHRNSDEQSTIQTDNDGTVAHTRSEKAETLNTFFTKCFNSLPIWKEMPLADTHPHWRKIHYQYLVLCCIRQLDQLKGDEDLAESAASCGRSRSLLRQEEDLTTQELSYTVCYKTKT